MKTCRRGHRAEAEAPLCRATARSQESVPSPKTQPSQPGHGLTQAPDPRGSLSVGTAHLGPGGGGDVPTGMDSEETLQIYSTSAPESPRQLWLPEVVALSLMPAPAPPPSPPPSLQRTGLDRILDPPIPPQPFQLSPPAAGTAPTPWSCCQPGQGACEGRGLRPHGAPQALMPPRWRCQAPP